VVGQIVAELLPQPRGESSRQHDPESGVAIDTRARVAQAAEFEPEPAARLPDDDRFAQRGDANVVWAN